MTGIAGMRTITERPGTVHLAVALSVTGAERRSHERVPIVPEGCGKVRAGAQYVAAPGVTQEISPVRTHLTTDERFWSKVDKNGPIPVCRPDLGPCWLWTGAVSGQTGYGAFRADGLLRGAHRVAYELAVGAIPSGLTLDHLCRGRQCVNPTHLEPVTQRVNMLRGISPNAALANSGRCAAGHPRTPENNYQRHDGGGRICRPCYRERKRRSYAARRQSA